MAMKTGFVLFIVFAVSLGAGGGPEATDVQAKRVRFTEAYGAISEVEIGEVVGELEKSTCAQFRLRHEDIEFFFENAVIVDGYSYQKEYPWYPCRLEGSLFLGMKGIRSKWTISPGGKGLLDLGEGDYLYLVCDEGCQEVFPESGNVYRDE